MLSISQFLSVMIVAGKLLVSAPLVNHGPGNVYDVTITRFDLDGGAKRLNPPLLRMPTGNIGAHGVGRVAAEFDVKPIKGKRKLTISGEYKTADGQIWAFDEAVDVDLDGARQEMKFAAGVGELVVQPLPPGAATAPAQLPPEGTPIIPQDVATLNAYVSAIRKGADWEYRIHNGDANFDVNMFQITNIPSLVGLVSVPAGWDTVYSGDGGYGWLTIEVGIGSGHVSAPFIVRTSASGQGEVAYLLTGMRNGKGAILSGVTQGPAN